MQIFIVWSRKMVGKDGRFYMKHPEVHGTGIIIVSKDGNSPTRSSYLRGLSEASVPRESMNWRV